MGFSEISTDNNILNRIERSQDLIHTMAAYIHDPRAGTESELSVARRTKVPAFLRCKNVMVLRRQL